MKTIPGITRQDENLDVVSWTLRNKLTWNSNQGAMEKNAVKSRLQKVVYIVSASINRLNDQLPRDYNKHLYLVQIG